MSLGPRVWSAAAFALLCAGAAHAAPAVMTFNTAPGTHVQDGRGFTDITSSNPWVENGLVLTEISPGSDPSYPHGSTYFSGVNGSPSPDLEAGCQCTTWTLTGQGGASFDLLSVDFSAFANASNPPASTNFTGTLAGGGSVQATIDRPSDSDWHTFDFTGFTNLASVTFQWNDISLDNITANVPEPASMGPLAMALLGILLVRRRRA